jgi:phenylalanyl-tRNA synthetase beta chain
VHPAVVEALELRAEHVIVAELAIAGLSAGQPSVPRTTTPPRYPAVERDLAVIVAADVPAAAVETSIRRHAGPLLRSVTLFDIYRGRPLDAAEKSLAYRLEFGADDRTLVESEVDGAVAHVTDGLADEVGGRLRG